jgi:hemolysin-activating ACP:hemolysin acyltransferase
MAILRLSMRQFEPFIFAIFQPTIFKFWVLIENYTIYYIFEITSIADDFSSGNKLYLIECVYRMRIQKISF